MHKPAPTCAVWRVCTCANCAVRYASTCAVNYSKLSHSLGVRQTHDHRFLPPTDSRPYSVENSRVANDRSSRQRRLSYRQQFGRLWGAVVEGRGGVMQCNVTVVVVVVLLLHIVGLMGSKSYSLHLSLCRSPTSARTFVRLPTEGGTNAQGGSESWQLQPCCRCSKCSTSGTGSTSRNRSSSSSSQKEEEDG